MPQLGHVPKGGYDPVLIQDNDFVQSFHTPNGVPWPAGAVLTLKIGTVASWPATLGAGGTGSWNVDKAIVNAVLDALAGNEARASITYTDTSGLDLTLTTGKTRPRG